ncbi:ABC transporter permease [Clostridium cellulovorans]|uniref:ABC3 transporter permease protein domain-containing protein n=1 Tax=Clostridium cellulovorans (strain ATCC 35296 / DSM 3052 / OCM 3 / 743B) TaxID=573061 RepID=D9SVT0_CLOC7|nr:ABC transporter permease [Clostridium cellulovorans]ADL53141.1 protein of unknown function DUF214 [Clostridium cellulovorans 743B]
MSLKDLIKTALSSMSAHKLRVFLTMIGIIIGISSVVTILSIGNGLKAELNSTVEDSAANSYSIQFMPDNSTMDSRIAEPFDKNDVYSVEAIDGVEKVETNSGGMLNVNVSNIEFFSSTTMGIIYPYKNETIKLLYGRNFNEGEEDQNLVILSQEVAEGLFDELEEGIGRAVTINNTNFEVIGIQEKSTGFSLLGPKDYIQEQSYESITDNSYISNFKVTVDIKADKDQVLDEVTTILKENHNDLAGKYEVADPQAITKALEKVIGGITTFIAVVSGISLFVGGIGVMNIMYVSVTERKREIGIRRAIGAKPRSIMLQFLIEAIFVTGSGGLIGILFGYLFGKIAGAFLPFPPVMTVGSFLGATICSVTVGIIFGIVPAIKASKLDPIKAIYQ